jgi:hypothetical protein
MVVGVHFSTCNISEEFLGFTNSDMVSLGSTIKQRHVAEIDYDFVDFEKSSFHSPAVLSKEKSGKDRTVNGMDYLGICWECHEAAHRFGIQFTLVRCQSRRIKCESKSL